jgi:hypothetical protein
VVKTRIANSLDRSPVESEGRKPSFSKLLLKRHAAGKLVAPNLPSFDFQQQLAAQRSSSAEGGTPALKAVNRAHHKRAKYFPGEN